METNNLSVKCIIAGILKGDVERLNRELSTEVANNFGVSNLGDRIPPHITLKAPFYTSKIAELDENLTKFASENRSVKIKIKNFGYFSDRTVFLDIVPSQELLSFSDRLTVSLKKLPWMYFNDQDVNKKIHITVASFDIQKKFMDIWSFLSGKKIEVDSEIDNVAILKKDGNKWLILKEFPLVP